MVLIIHAGSMHSESVVEKYRASIQQNIKQVFPVLKHFDVPIVGAT